MFAWYMSAVTLHAVRSVWADLVCKNEGAEDARSRRDAPSKGGRTFDAPGESVFIVLSIPFLQLTLEVLVKHRV